VAGKHGEQMVYKVNRKGEIIDLIVVLDAEQQ
jgi:hypothetical protein